MQTETLRVAIVGAGSNTVGKHIPGLLAQAGVAIAGVCNRTAESSRRVAGQFGLERIYDHWGDVVSDAGVDAVVIGTWPYLHERVTVAALESGKHVLCEARMAMDAAEAHRMLAAAQARPHLTAQVVPSPMTLGVDRMIQGLLAEGWIGDVLSVEINAGGTFLDPDAPLHWRQDTALSGMNIMGMGIWYEALMRWVGTASQVMAQGRTFAPMRRDGNGCLRAVAVPDHVEVIGGMVCGALLHMQVSAVTGLAGSPHATLHGSRGTLRFAAGKLWGGRLGDAALQEIAIPENRRGGWRVEEEFVNAVRGRERIALTTFEDGVRYMEFTEAVHRSVSQGIAVALPLARH